MKITIELDGNLLTYLKDKGIKEKKTINDLIEEAIYILKMVEIIENKDKNIFTEMYIKEHGNIKIEI